MAITGDKRSIYREPDNDAIIVYSTLARGKQGKDGIRMESRWNLSEEHRTITLTSVFLVTRFGNEPLMPSEVPDRHQRDLREFGTKHFKVKPFRGLRLYPPLPDNILFVAERTITTPVKELTEVKPLIAPQDATLWKILLPNETQSLKRGTPQTVKRELKSKKMIDSEMTTPQLIRTAQENSHSIRNEYVRLMEQAFTGLSAIKRLLVLKEHGLDQELLDYIWMNVFGTQSPESFESIMKKVVGLLDVRF